MRNDTAYSGIRKSRRPRSRTFVALALVVLISAWALLSNISALDLDFSYLSPSSSPSPSPSPADRHQLQQQGLHEEHIDEKDENHVEYKLTYPSTLGPLEPAVSLLDPNTKYLSYLPFAGLTNQFMAFEVGALLSRKLNRTLILPPIISNSHDHDNTHQRWSNYFDLPRFTHLSGVPVVEWDLIRPLTATQRIIGRDRAIVDKTRTAAGEHDYELVLKAWDQVAENLTCHIVYGFGGPNLEINYSAQNFQRHFLFRLIFQQPPPLKPGMTVYNKTKLTGLTTGLDDLVAIDDLLARYADNEDHVLMLSNTFKLKDPGHIGRIWNEIGKNIHFVPQIMEYVTEKINEELQRDQGIVVIANDDPEEKVFPELEVPIEMNLPENLNENATESGVIANPAAENITAPLTRIPHIALHLRRSDIGSKCTDTTMDSCLVPFEHYIDAVARARTAAAKRGLVSRLPVVVTTDTTSEHDFQKIQELGWHRLDHEKYGTAKLWGPFGPALIDAAVLAHADELVGSKASTMSKIAASRQRAWYGREALYPILNRTQRKARRRSMAATQEGEEEAVEESWDEDVRIVY
ncbi:hypothetical protein BC939DRAFT_462629 [Gamsiella multidivaricata]|uniref:uncharacterized protein n=1 Tax=Gamsiella multidivaricata TaxID=101098 RepID=UPI00221F99A1|nr:uncharacterized protein BC939DRAFT_462629 [Gamsiella multidivaricata]KAI7818596.1 hypothetical protein BC939DRAFT_462629 [Gamsiella multidivaricata]